MSREISSQQNTEKFSFISALTISQDINEVLEAEATTSVKDAKTSPETEDLMGELETSSALVVNSSSLVISAPATISTQWYKLDLNPAVSELDLSSVAFDRSHDSSSSHSGNGKYLDKIFFTAACGYLLWGLWGILGYKNLKLADILGLISNNRQETVSQADAEFLDYIERSLSTIDRKLLTRQEAIKTSSNKDSATNIVYVPIYTPNPTPKAQKVDPIPLPPPPPPIATVTTPATKILQPQSENAATSPIVSPSSDASSPASDGIPAVKPSRSYTLVGLMEWGEKPTAMFKGKGGTKKVVLGENIDDSGWKLEAIKERNVIITRQGKSRTINIGEKF
ncbi:MAG: hypothetical protein QNJ32_24435 [Xenococcaceae cyanobacterium MO_167.B27]|nr:hypothetical protein [Xenococcaceae cyanobacterium MO_167.B27]